MPGSESRVLGDVGQPEVRVILVDITHGSAAQAHELFLGSGVIHVVTTCSAKRLNRHQASVPDCAMCAFTRCCLKDCEEARGVAAGGRQYPGIRAILP